MFDENKYRACFDMVKAPESMEREILNMTTEKNKIRKVGFGRRIAVVAAVLVMVLSLGVVAQAAGWFNLGDAVIGRLDMPENDVPTVMGEGETAPNVEEFIGLIGAKGSPEYEGVKEWFEYYWSEEYEIVSTEEAITDPAYNIYGAFSQKSIDVLDAICEKYGLLLVDGPKAEGLGDILQSQHFDFPPLAFFSPFRAGRPMAKATITALISFRNSVGRSSRRATAMISR